VRGLVADRRSTPGRFGLGIDALDSIVVLA
jgi:hypothetical protein